MKCPKCGEKMYSMGNGGFDTERGNYVEMKYACPKCGYEVSENANNLPNYVYREPLSQPNYAVTNYGWICPKCGAVLSPSTKECPYCTPHKVTCGTISDPTTAQTLKSSSLTLKSSSLTSPDKITVTGNNITSQPQAETKVSK